MTFGYKLVSIALLSDGVVFGSGGMQPRPLQSNGGRQSSHSRVALKPCQQPDVDGEALCGTYDVYENRAAKSGRKISMNIVVLPAMDLAHAPDPVFCLSGGPGADATGTSHLQRATSGGLSEGT